MHGGIPVPDTASKGIVTAINDVPTRLPDPINESELAWDLLWNDPIRLALDTNSYSLRLLTLILLNHVLSILCRQDEIDSDIEIQLNENEGFIDNFARGTAHMFRYYLVVRWSGPLV